MQERKNFASGALTKWWNRDIWMRCLLQAASVMYTESINVTRWACYHKYAILQGIFQVVLCRHDFHKHVNFIVLQNIRRNVNVVTLFNMMDWTSQNLYINVSFFRNQIYTILPPFLSPRFATSLPVLTQSPRTSEGKFVTLNIKTIWIIYVDLCHASLTPDSNKTPPCVSEVIPNETP